MNEFINSREGQLKGNSQIDFNLLPPEQVIKLKLQFDLLQLTDNNQANITQSITVEWMIKEIVFNVISDEKGTFITLQRLKEDIKDLQKTIVNISSIGDNTFFFVDGKEVEAASLAQLLPPQQVLRKDQTSPRIALIVDSTKASAENGQLAPLFSVY